MQLNIDTSEVVAFTNKLEKLHRSALPVAIRGALNSAAFDVKTDTMPKSAKSTFTQRQPNFFKATSRVNKAIGFNVDSMSSAVGFIGNQQAVRDLEEQEFGGKIGGRSFIPMNPARVGNSIKKKVRSGSRLSRIKKIVNSTNVAGKNRQEKFMKSVIEAGEGGYVIGNFTPKILWNIRSIKSFGGKMIVKKTPIYSFEKSRMVSVKSTKFMSNAAFKTLTRVEGFYIIEAEKQIKRLMNK